MITWTFDLVALFVGFFIGIIVGIAALTFVELRDGGFWDIGFNDGCKLKSVVERLERLVETKKEG